jgi:hypothetical protein
MNYLSSNGVVFSLQLLVMQKVFIANYLVLNRNLLLRKYLFLK